MATSQELLQKLIDEASTLTTVFKTYRAELDKSVNTAITTFQTAVTTKMNQALDYVSTIQGSRTYYVDAVDGLDTNTGLTTLSPFKTIAKAVTFSAGFCTTNINLRIGQKHIVNSFIAPKGHVFFKRYRLTNDAPYNSMNSNQVILSGSVSDMAAFEAGSACIYVEDPTTSFYTALNYKTVFPTVEDAAAYMLTKDTNPVKSASTGGTAYIGVNDSLASSFSSVSFSTIFIQLPRYDLMEDEYYRVLKPYTAQFIRKGDSFTKTMVNFYSCHIKTNRGLVFTQNQGPGSVIIDQYGSNIYMDSKLSPVNYKPFQNNYKLIEAQSLPRIDYFGAVEFYYPDVEANVAASFTTFVYPTTTIQNSLTDTDHPAKNIASRVSPSAKVVAEINTKLAARIFFPDNTNAA